MPFSNLSSGGKVAVWATLVLIWVMSVLHLVGFISLASVLDKIPKKTAEEVKAILPKTSSAPTSGAQTSDTTWQAVINNGDAVRRDLTEVIVSQNATITTLATAPMSGSFAVVDLSPVAAEIKHLGQRIGSSSLETNDLLRQILEETKRQTVSRSDQVGHGGQSFNHAEVKTENESSLLPPNQPIKHKSAIVFDNEGKPVTLINYVKESSIPNPPYAVRGNKSRRGGPEFSFLFSALHPANGTYVPIEHNSKTLFSVLSYTDVKKAGTVTVHTAAGDKVFVGSHVFRDTNGIFVLTTNAEGEPIYDFYPDGTLVDAPSQS